MTKSLATLIRKNLPKSTSKSNEQNKNKEPQETIKFVKKQSRYMKKPVLRKKNKYFHRS